MIELVLVYCLLDSPDRCVERREAMNGPSGTLQCMISAQEHAQDYLAAHPKYRLNGWRCEVDKPAEEPA